MGVVGQVRGSHHLRDVYRGHLARRDEDGVVRANSRAAAHEIQDTILVPAECSSSTERAQVHENRLAITTIETRPRVGRHVGVDNEAVSREGITEALGLIGLDCAECRPTRSWCGHVGVERRTFGDRWRDGAAEPARHWLLTHLTASRQ